MPGQPPERCLSGDAPWRGAVVAEALSWLGTPYHPCARVKGPRGGVDCACLIAEVYERAGAVGHIDIAPYPPDWHLHADPTQPDEISERLLSCILPRAVEVAEPLPGDIATWRVGRAFGHIAIIMPPGWPAIIHADLDARQVMRADGTQGALVTMKNGKLRPVRFFTPIVAAP